MNFLKNALNFHKDVFIKISLNKSFFILAAFIFLIGDFITYLEPQMSQVFKDKRGEGLGIQEWGFYILMLLNYIMLPCLYSMYFYRKDKTVSKLRAYFRPLINGRMYAIFILIVIAMLGLFSFSISMVPELVTGLSESVKVYLDPTVSTEMKEAVFLENGIFMNAYDKTSGFSLFLAFFSFFVGSIIVYGAFIFSMPLVVKSKKYKAFSSMKTSVVAFFKNFGTILLTLGVVYLVWVFTPVLMNLILPESLLDLYTTLKLNYLSRPVNSLVHALIFFYVIISLEKFILTNEKNSV
jgi:hypothetical protein